MRNKELKANRMSSLIELEPILAPTLAMPDRMYAALKHRILSGRLLPKQRIVEKDICTEMNVSRTPLREALNRLALEGLVILLPYRGYVVTPVTVEDFQNLCELRRIIEPGTAALAAQRATAEDIERLVAVAETRYTLGDPVTYENYLRANSAFHLALVRCTGNSRIESIVMSLLDQHQRPLYLGLGRGIDAEASTAEHLEVIDAVRAHDPVRAQTLMYEHISRGEQRIVKALHAAGV